MQTRAPRSNSDKPIIDSLISTQSYFPLPALRTLASLTTDNITDSLIQALQSKLEYSDSYVREHACKAVARIC